MRFQWTQKYCGLVVTLLGILIFPASTLAQPANDDCVHAQAVTLGTLYTINNQAATDEPLTLDPGTCNTSTLSSLTRGVWFRFDSTFDGAIKCNETSLQNIGWGVWEMDTAGATCPTDGPATYCSFHDELHIRVQNNKTYYFLVYTDSATVSTISLAVTFSQITPPANDTCAGATLVSNGTTFTTATTAYTNDLIDIGSCNNAAIGDNMIRGVWFRYDHPAMAPNQLFRLNETSAHNISAGIWVMPTISAACPTSGPATICGADDLIELLVTAENTYYILVSTDASAVSTVALSLTFSLLTPPQNDDCANAQVITLDTPYAVSNNAAFGEPFDVGVCNTATLTSMTGGVWFRYDSTATGVIRGAETSTQDIAAGVWEMDTAFATCPTSGPATFCAATDTFQVNVQPSKTYYILVYTDSLTPATVPMSITFSEVLPPANDECSGAQTIALDTVYTIDSRTAGDDQVFLGCSARGVASCGIWFKYVCTLTGVLRVDETSAYNIAVGAWEMDTVSAACPTDPSPIFCSSAEIFNMPVTDGMTYYFLVQNDALTAPTVPMSISFYSVPVPVNDDCVNAIVVSSFPSQFTVDNRGASHDLDGGTCDAPPEFSPHGVWFRYDSVSTTGFVLIEEFSSQTVAMGVWVTSDCPTVGQANVCGSYNFGGPTQRFGFSVTPGNTYFINMHVDSSTGVPQVAMELLFTLIQDAGDNCDLAVPIVGTGVFTFHNQNAFAPQAPFTTLTCGPTAGSAMNLDSWYKWVAPVSGKASIMVHGLPPVNPARLAVYPESAPGMCPTSAATVVRCVVMGSNPTASIPDGTAAVNGIDTWNVVAGQTYFFQFASQLLGSSFNHRGFADMELLVEPTVHGRCCIGTTSCVLTSLEDCTTRGGTYGGDGSTCVSFSGTTTSYAGGPITMPSNNPYTSGSITIADTFMVEDVEVVVDINNPAVGDVRLALVKDGSMVTLTHRGRYGYSPVGTTGLDLSGAYTFNDAGTTSLFDAANNAADPIPVGVYRPAGSANINNGLRANFHGKAAAGVWTLVAACDAASGGGGVVNSWILRLKRGSTPVCGGSSELCCRGTTCNPVDAGACTGPVAGSASLVVSSCGAGNTMATCCYADYNHDGSASIDDLFLYLNAYFTGSPYANMGGNGSDGPTIDDLFLYINAYFGSCG